MYFLYILSFFAYYQLYTDYNTYMYVLASETLASRGQPPFAHRANCECIFKLYIPCDILSSVSIHDCTTASNIEPEYLAFALLSESR